MENNLKMLDEIAKAIDELDETKATTLVDEALKKGFNPVDVLQQGVVAGLKSYRTGSW